MDNYIDHYKNKSALVFGGGTSLIGFDFTCIEGNHILFGANRVFEFCDLDVLCMADWSFYNSKRNLIDKKHMIKILLWKTRWGNESVDSDILYAPNAEAVSAGIIENPKRIFYGGGGAGGMCVHAAVFMGCNPIYLFGLDFYVGENNRLHFHNGHPKGSHAYYPDDIERMKKKYSSMANALKIKLKMYKVWGFNIYSCSERSLLNDVIPFKMPEL